MIKPNPKTALALTVVGLLVAIGAMSGMMVVASNALSPVSVLAGLVSAGSFVGVALLAWTLLAAQMRKERLTLSRSVQEKLEASGQVNSTLTSRIDRLDAGQRKTLNVLRGTATTVREGQDRIGEQLEASRVELAALGGVSAELKRLTARVRKAEQLLDGVESRNRKMLNVVRAEGRSSVEKFAAFGRDLKAYDAKALKAANSADEASVTTRKMHNFLRRDGSIQIALDHFVAGERRLLQAIDAAALDHGDSLAALELAFRASEASSTQTKSSLVQLSESHEALTVDVERHQSDLQRVVDETEEHVLAHATAGSSGAEVDLRNSLKRIGADSIAGSREVARRMADRVQRGANRQSIEVVRQVEALLQLVPRVDTSEQRFPPSGWWALPADTLLFLSDYIGRVRPKRILEIGSGASTIWTGTFAKQAGASLVSLEHDGSYAEKTRTLIDQYGLTGTVSLLHAPLKPVQVDEKTFDWYDHTLLSSLDGPFDLVIVDGPPEATGDMARYPAFPLVEGLLSETCLVVLDDTHRENEKKILDDWIARGDGFEKMSVDLMRTGVMIRHG